MNKIAAFLCIVLVTIGFTTIGQNPIKVGNGKGLSQKQTSKSQQITSNHILLDAVYFWKWNSDSLIWDLPDSSHEMNFTYDAGFNNLSFNTCNDTDNYNDTGLFIRSYNANNDTTSVFYKIKLGNNKYWVNKSTDTLKYDTDNYITDKKYQTFNGTSWDEVYEYAYRYDANKNLTSDIYYFHSVPDSNNSFSYDANNHLIGYLYQSWNGNWVNIYKDSITYNVNNKISSVEYQTGNGSAWKDSLLILKTYDVNNNLTSDLYQIPFGTAWVNSHLITYTYDYNNNLITKIYQKWNISGWVNDSLNTYSYDANNNLTSDTSQVWKTPVWMNSKLSSFTYDVFNNRLSSLKQIWNGSNWSNVNLYTWTFDANHLNLSKVYKGFDLNGNLALVGDSVYYYYISSSGIENITSRPGSIIVYPNPNSGRFTFLNTNKEITIRDIEMYNSLGEEIMNVKQENIQNLKQNIDMSLQPAGIYFYRCLDQNGSLAGSGKFIIQK